MLIIKKTSATRSNHREIENKKDESTVYLYGEIGGWFGIDHLEWVKEFNAIDAKIIHLRVDSDGGDVFAARTIKVAIMQHKAKVIAHIDGLAASSASFIVMGADEIEIVNGGFLMIHNALSLLDILGFFNANDLDELISDLNKERGLHDKINESLANDYVKRSGGDIKDFVQFMNDETWFTAEEALEENLVDRIYDGEPVNGKYDLSLFNEVPEQLKIRVQASQSSKDPKKDLNERDCEKALRDAGASRNRAKEILAKGFKSDPNEREVQEKARLRAEREAEAAEKARLREAEKADKSESQETVCQNCKKTIDYEGTPEAGMGFIICPECGKTIDQTGKVVAHRDVEPPKPKKDRTAELLTKGDLITLKQNGGTL